MWTGNTISCMKTDNQNVASSHNFWAQNARKHICDQEPAPDLAWWSLLCSPDALAAFRKAGETMKWEGRMGNERLKRGRMEEYWRRGKMRASRRKDSCRAGGSVIFTLWSTGRRQACRVTGRGAASTCTTTRRDSPVCNPSFTHNMWVILSATQWMGWCRKQEGLMLTLMLSLIVDAPAWLIFPYIIKSRWWRAVVEEVGKGCSEFCITWGTVTRTTGILIHSRLKELTVNFSQLSGRCLIVC